MAKRSYQTWVIYPKSLHQGECFWWDGPVPLVSFHRNPRQRWAFQEGLRLGQLASQRWGDFQSVWEHTETSGDSTWTPFSARRVARTRGYQPITIRTQRTQSCFSVSGQKAAQNPAASLPTRLSPRTTASSSHSSASKLPSSENTPRSDFPTGPRRERDSWE